jgi:hypothetical protein
VGYHHCPACRKQLTYRGYCGPCQGQWRRAKDRACGAHCGALAHPSGSYCTRCHYQIRCRRFDRGDRICECGTRIPKGYRDEKCPDCRSLENREQYLRRRGNVQTK